MFLLGILVSEFSILNVWKISARESDQNWSYELVLVTFTTGHVIGILLEDSMIRNSSKDKALRFKSHDPSGFSVCPHILQHTGNPEDFQVFSSAGENLSVSNRFKALRWRICGRLCSKLENPAFSGASRSRLSSTNRTISTDFYP